MGSSPLARGLRYVPWCRECNLGIIPARAGFTLVSPAGVPPPEDHPRSRGVYLPSATTQPEFWGSSPLARGLRVRWDSTYRDIGIIPARAGFT